MLQNDQRIKDLIDDLDRSIPADGAAVRLDQYGGGPDEGQIIGNRAGYLRLGIELLKAAYVEPIKADDRQNKELQIEDIEVDLGYIITPESIINFDWFQRSEEIKPPTEYRQTIKDRLILFSIIGIIGATVLFALKGCVSFVVGFF